MNRIVISIAVATTLLAATTVPGLAQRSTAIPPPPPQAPAASQTTQAPYAPTYPDQGPAGSTPLFNIGKVPVVVWAPVEPPYNSKSNGTVAANWPWTGDAY
jgi:hypothetical protein